MLWCSKANESLRAIIFMLAGSWQWHFTIWSMTTRQQQVVKAWLEKGSMKEAANALKISPKTIEFHLSEVRKQLNIGPLIWLAVWAVRNRIANPVFLIILLFCSPVLAQETNPIVKLAWTKSLSTSVTNYLVYYGVVSMSYTNATPVGDVDNTVVTLPTSLIGVPVFFAVTAQGTNDTGDMSLESVFSNEVMANGPSNNTIASSTTIGSGTLRVGAGTLRFGQ